VIGVGVAVEAAVGVGVGAGCFSPPWSWQEIPVNPAAYKKRAAAIFLRSDFPPPKGLEDPAISAPPRQNPMAYLQVTMK
jgi:hypothetical protein